MPGLVLGRNPSTRVRVLGATRCGPAHQTGILVGPQAHGHMRVIGCVADPIGALATAGQEIDRPPLEGEPQLHGSREPRASSDGRQPDVRLTTEIGRAQLPASRTAPNARAAGSAWIRRIRFETVAAPNTPATITETRKKSLK